ncbi:MAG: hypothetical protein ABSA49_13510 [Rhizomicrobium sp.]|jgi:hypothetical protein
MRYDFKVKWRSGVLTIRRAIAPLSGCILLTGCALFVPGVDDLRFVSVQSIEVSALDLHDTLGNLAPKLAPTYVIGRIIVVTKADIHKIGEQSELNIWHELTLCKTGALVANWPGVYYEGVDINSNSTEATKSLYRARAVTHKEDEPYNYEIYFDPRSARSEPKGVGKPWAFEPYDEAREPRELCLRIGGGNMVGGHFVSNTVVVPSVELGRAFQHVSQ